jgi:hypothetical protein
LATAHGAKTVKTKAGGLSVDPASRKATKKGGGKKVGSRMLKWTCSCPEPFIIRCAKAELSVLCLVCKAPFRLDETSIPESSTLHGAKGQYRSRAAFLAALREEGFTKADPLAPLKGEEVIKALKEAIKKVRAEMRADDDEPDERRGNPDPQDNPDYDPSNPEHRVPMTWDEYEIHCAGLEKVKQTKAEYARLEKEAHDGIPDEILWRWVDEWSDEDRTDIDPSEFAKRAWVYKRLRIDPKITRAARARRAKQRKRAERLKIKKPREKGSRKANTEFKERLNPKVKKHNLDKLLR